MFDTMYAEEGVGLAAPQVGVGQRVIVVDPTRRTSSRSR
jgi:peptide deformylase